MRISTDWNGFQRWHEAAKDQVPSADTQIITSEGHRIAAHSHVLVSHQSVRCVRSRCWNGFPFLSFSGSERFCGTRLLQASASPVLENMVYEPRKNWNSERVIQILGVPSGAVFAFLYFIYSSRYLTLSSLLFFLAPKDWELNNFFFGLFFFFFINRTLGSAVRPYHRRRGKKRWRSTVCCCWCCHTSTGLPG